MVHQYDYQTEDPEYFRPGTLGRIQKCLWDLFEKPHTSLGARVTTQSQSCPAVRGKCYHLDCRSHLHLIHHHQHGGPHPQHTSIFPGDE